MLLDKGKEPKNTIEEAEQYIGLFDRCSSQTNTLWGLENLADKKTLWARLLEKDPCLSATTITELDQGQSKTQVKLMRKESGYELIMRRYSDDEERYYRNEFADLGGLARFIEENTSIRIGGFA